VASAVPQWPPPDRVAPPSRADSPSRAVPASRTTATRRRDPHRRQRILTAAAALVAERGYHDVGMTDIGAAAGITGSAVYRHFDSKSAVLVAMFDAVVDDLAREASAIAAVPADPLTALRRLIQTQVRFVLRDGALARVYHNESTSLPAADQHRLRRKQRLYLEEWVYALSQLRPSDGGAVLRALVHAAVGAIQSALFFHSGLPERQLADLLTAVAEAALFADLRKAGDPGGLH
jgi:AcrR family transcriptional regulator